MIHLQVMKYHIADHSIGLMVMVVCKWHPLRSYSSFSRTLLTSHRTQASYIFHNANASTCLYFPIAFCDTTSIGRIINRFSQDNMATLDEDLAQTMSQVISMGSSVLGSIGAIAGSTKGVFIPICTAIGFD